MMISVKVFKQSTLPILDTTSWLMLIIMLEKSTYQQSNIYKHNNINNYKKKSDYLIPPDNTTVEEYGTTL